MPNSMIRIGRGVFIASLFILTPYSATTASDKFVGTTLDKTFTVNVLESDLAGASCWESNSENPPLSARKARSLADILKNKLVKDSKDWKWRLECLTLRSYENKASPGSWFWLAHYHALPTHSNLGGGIPDLYVVVLMSGKTIQPSVENRFP